MVGESAKIREYFNRLRRARRYRFPPLRQPLNCPPKHGVYLIFSPRGRVAHVGRTTRTGSGLLDRLRAHLAGNSSFVDKYLTKRRRYLLRRGYTYSWVLVPSPRHRALVEALATGRLCPLHIGTSKRTAS